MKARTLPASLRPPQGRPAATSPGGPSKHILRGSGESRPAPVLVPGLGFPYLLCELRPVPCTQLAVGSE